MISSPNDDDTLSRLAAIVESSDDAIVGKTLGGIVTDWNRGAEAIFGYRADEIIGQSITMIVPSDRRSEHEAILDRIGHGERIDHFETQRCCKDGSVIEVSVTISPIYDAKGRLRGASKVARDITESKQSQLRIQELQAELIHVSRFTALGEMASTLAHELNQPLTAVASYLKGAGRLIDAGESSGLALARDAIERAAQQALRAGQIIRRLRQFVTRGETDRQAENLAKLIEEACALALVGARQSGVKVSVKFDSTSTHVLADKIQVQQVLLNLVRNAIEAMQEVDRRELTLSTHRLEDDTVRIDVADSGPGIAPEIARQLFQPFITTKQAGMGVGLSISRTIIEAHGGRIWIDPNPGGGVIFRVTLKTIDVEELAHG
jgi:two-component system sensor kinase FixL